MDKHFIFRRVIIYVIFHFNFGRLHIYYTYIIYNLKIIEYYK